MSKKISIIIIILLFSQIFVIIFLYKQYKYFKQKDSINNLFTSQISKSDPTTLLFHDLAYDISDIKVTYDFDEKLDDNITKVDIIYYGKFFHKEYLGGLYTAYLLDEIMFGQPILVVIRGEGQSIYTNMLSFDSHDESINEVSFIDKEKNPPDELCCNYALFIPQKDGIHYDIGMPDFFYKIPKIEKYRYNKEKHTFVEK